MPTENKKIIGQDNRKEALVKREWRDFAKTTAYQDLMDYAKIHDNQLVGYAKDLAMPGPDGKSITLSGETANYLLQRAAGIGIITTYIRLYSE